MDFIWGSTAAQKYRCSCPYLRSPMLEGNKGLLTIFSSYTQLQSFVADPVEKLSLTKWGRKGQMLHWWYRHRKGHDMFLSRDFWLILHVHRHGHPLSPDWNLPPKHQAHFPSDPQWSLERNFNFSCARWRLAADSTKGVACWKWGVPTVNWMPWELQAAPRCHTVVWYSWGVWGPHQTLPVTFFYLSGSVIWRQDSECVVRWHAAPWKESKWVSIDGYTVLMHE